jgi:hypothetical protein
MLVGGLAAKMALTKVAKLEWLTERMKVDQTVDLKVGATVDLMVSKKV